MANFFQKVEATRCTGRLDSECENFKNQTRFLSLKKNCDICASPMSEETRLDMVKVVATALLCTMLAGGGLYLVRGQFTGLFTGIGSDDSDRAPDQPRGKPPAAAKLAIVVIESDSGDRTTLADLERLDDSTYRARRVYHEHDKFRLRVDGKSSYLYVYYRSGSQARQFASGPGATATLPSEAEWFELDNTRGMEEFTVVASRSPVSDLDQISDGFDAGRLESALRRVVSDRETKLVRIQLRHE